MVEKGVRGGIFHAIHRHAAANNRCIKSMTKTKNYHILCIWVQIYTDGECLKNYL